MLKIVITICALASPAECTTHTMMSENATPWACMNTGLVKAASVIRNRPELRLKSVVCRRAKLMDKLKERFKDEGAGETESIQPPREPSPF